MNRNATTVRSPSRWRRRLAGLVIGGALSLAGHAWAETLADAAALVYDGNPQLLAQRAQLRAVQESYHQALGAYAPSASAQISRTFTSVPDLDVETNYGSDQLALEQPLYLGGAGHANLNLARAQSASGREALAQSEQQILQSLVTAFLAVRRDEEGVAIARENVQVLEQQLSETEAKFALYEVTITDRSQAEARLAAARSRLLAREGQLAQSRGDYLAVVGQNPGALAAPPVVANLPPTIDEALARAERNNRALRIAIYARQQSQARLELAKAQARPTVSLQVQSAETPLNSFNPIDSARTTTAGLVVRQTFPINGAIRSRIIAAEAQDQRDQLLVDDSRRQAIRIVSQAWNQLAAARATLSARRLEIRAQQTAYESVREEQRLGLRTVLEVLNAEQELRDAKFGLAETTYQEYVASTALLAAMGELRFVDFVPGLSEIRPAQRRAFHPPWVYALDKVDAIGVQDPPPIDTVTARRSARPDRVLALPPAAQDGP